MNALMMLVLGVAAIALFVRYVMHVEQRRRHFYQEWLATAEALQLVASGEESKRSMVGHVGGVPVRVDFERERRGSGKTRHSVDVTTFFAGGDGRLPKSLELWKDSAWRQLGRAFGGSDTTTGDDEFDEGTELPTMNAYVSAALSEPLREQLLGDLNEGAWVSNGVVTWKHEGVDEPDRRWLGAHIEHIAGLAEQLSVTPDTLARRLAHNAVHDTHPAVRQRNLSFLIASETSAPRELIATTARALLEDPLRLTRFHAASQLGAEGHPTLRALVSDPQEDPALRARALAELHEQDASEIEHWIASFLAQSPLEVTQAALGVVAARRLNAHAARVIELCAADEAALRVAAARTLGALESPEIELALLRLLADEEVEVQTAAAESLGNVGSVSAVEPLLPLTKGFGRGELRHAARGAIARIQARLGDVEGGRVSLAEDDALAGAVALADAEAAAGGEVTLTPEEQTSAAKRA